MIERLRRRKSPEEVARVAAAAAAADGALAEVLPRLAERPTESDVAAELDHLMRRRGASGSAFDTIVAAGENSACRTPARARAPSSPETWWSSTSGRSWTATAPT